MARTISNNSFYLHLDSSVDDLDIFKDNKLGEFTQILPDSINLDCKDNEHWEVALEELILPNALNNIYAGQNNFEYSVIVNYNLPPEHAVPQTKISRVLKISANPYKITVPFQLTAGYYDSLSFTTSINEKIEKIKTYLYSHFGKYGLKKEDMLFQLNFSTVTRKFQLITCPKRFEQLTVKDKKVQRILGLSSENYPEYPEIIDQREIEQRDNHGEYEAPLQPNLNRHFQKIILYCDIAQESILNDKYVSLLRVFDISTLLNSTYSSIEHDDPSKRMPLTCLNPHIQRLHFFPLNSNTLQEITIKISNEYGENLVFCETKDVSHVLLFFKKIKNGAFETI